jgi:hypothetical protein
MWVPHSDASLVSMARLKHFTRCHELLHHFSQKTRSRRAPSRIRRRQSRRAKLVGRAGDGEDLAVLLQSVASRGERPAARRGRGHLDAQAEAEDQAVAVGKQFWLASPCGWSSRPRFSTTGSAGGAVGPDSGITRDSWLAFASGRCHRPGQRADLAESEVEGHPEVAGES